ncbi:MAG: 16S rRNA (guanine(966)-N(2))-methyltransferase RsmD [Coxiella endosymbiont of Haemaphysalis qinghaiensis]
MLGYLPGKLRIIGGKWRGRKIAFPSSLGLRPTIGRIRETLFNWLSNYIEDTYCLDLFAGSGALGFEALSRGCAHVTFIDRSNDVIKALKQSAVFLNTANTEFICQTFPFGIPSLKNSPFDVVFLDPPFCKGLINQAALWLEEVNILAPEACIYIEAEKNISLILPNNWEIYREKRTASLFYGLFLRFKKGK